MLNFPKVRLQLYTAHLLSCCRFMPSILSYVTYCNLTFISYYLRSKHSPRENLAW